LLEIHVIELISNIIKGHQPKKSLIPLGSSRLDSTRLDTFDVSSESRRACRPCRAVLFQHRGRRTSYSARLYKFSRFYALTYTNPICSVK